MKSRTIAAAMIVSMLAAACGTTDREPVRASPSVTQPPAMVTLTLMANFDECHSIGGCRAYASINLVGEAPDAETRLTFLGEGPVAQGLPASLAPGSYIVHFRLVAVSDASLNGVREETTLAICDEPVLAQGNHAAEEVELAVAFRAQSCEITQTSKVADV